MEFLLPTFCPRIYVKCEKYLNYSSRNKNVLHIITIVTDAKKKDMLSTYRSYTLLEKLENHTYSQRAYYHLHKISLHHGVLSRKGHRLL